MKENSNPAADIPAYLAGTLDERDRKRLEEALAQSSELRKEFLFWRNLRLTVREKAARDAEGHLSPENILDFAEGRITGGDVERHLMSCQECREDLELIRSTYPAKEARQTTKNPSFMDTILEFFTMPRIAYALGFLIIAIVAASGIAYYIAHRTPEWRQLQARGDSMMEQGRTAEARTLYQQALDTSDPSDQASIADRSTLLDSLAMIHLRDNRTEEARRLLDQSLALRTSAGESGTWTEAWIHDQLGNINKRTGNDLSAELSFRKADAIREELAKLYPQDQELQRYRRNVALIKLVPQIGFRGPEPPPFPSFGFDQETTHLEIMIELRKNRDISAPYLPTLTSPSRHVLPIPDTLRVDPLHPTERTLRLTLSRRFFEEGRGIYRIGIRKPGSDFEDVYFFMLSSL